MQSGATRKLPLKLAISVCEFPGVTTRRLGWSPFSWSTKPVMKLSEPADVTQRLSVSLVDWFERQHKNPSLSSSLISHLDVGAFPRTVRPNPRKKSEITLMQSFILKRPQADRFDVWWSVSHKLKYFPCAELLAAPYFLPANHLLRDCWSSCATQYLSYKTFFCVQKMSSLDAAWNQPSWVGLWSCLRRFCYLKLKTHRWSFPGPNHVFYLLWCN